MKKLKTYENFINESAELLKKIVEDCEDILLELNDDLAFTNKLYCHALGLTDPKYLGFVKKKSGTYGYLKDDSILFQLKSDREFQYSDIEDVIERLKFYLSTFGYEIEFVSSKDLTGMQIASQPEIQITSGPADDITLLRGGGRFTIKNNWILVFRFVKNPINNIETYENFINEEIDFRKGIAAAGLMGALSGSPAVAQTTTPTSMSTERDGVEVYKNKIEEISTIRKEKSKDEKLSIILDEIKSNLNSKDSTKFIELYTKLTSHIESEYGYKIPEQKVEDQLTEAGIGSMAKNMTIFEIMGWLGSICLAICGIPQAWQSYKDKHSDGISWGFVLLWAFGEVFALAYVYDKLDLPLLLNYATNILILGVILYYKVKPQNKLEL